MEIENVETLRSIINNQNKLIDFLYKEQDRLIEQIKELQEKIELFCENED